jgi:hypothetical protein
MKIAIMQPYFIPYFLYYQLLNFVDIFVLLDDVAYKNKGWINRNTLLFSGLKKWLTIPLSGASQNKCINEISILKSAKWTKSILATLNHSYKNSPYKNEVISIFESIISCEKTNLSDFLEHSIVIMNELLEINTKVIKSSSIQNSNLTGKYRILDLCSKLNATEYINLPGGVNLYCKNEFEANNIILRFILPNIDISLPTSFGGPYDSSILDLLFVNGVYNVKMNIYKTLFQ